MDSRKIISIGLPFVSVVLVVGFLLFTQPQITGLAVGEFEGGKRTIDAAISLETVSGEIIPETASVAISLDDRQAVLRVRDFIAQSGGDYEYVKGSVESIGYEGNGFTGNHTYTIQLASLPLDNRVDPGEHTFRIKMTYLQHVLLEKEEVIVVS